MQEKGNDHQTVTLPQATSPNCNSHSLINAEIQFDKIPDKLKKLRNWVNWIIGYRDGKPTKIPITPKTNNFAKSTDPGTWGSFEDAVQFYLECENESIAGIGFMFKDSPFFGVDIDRCRDPETGVIDTEALQILRKLKTYAEVSPSGTGAKVFGIGSLPPGGKRKGHIELYDTDRFFTVTGWHIPETPLTISDCQRELEELHHSIFGKSDTERDEDSRLIHKAMIATNGEKFRKLWNGDCSDYSSQSEADLSLCSMLAFWTNRDRVRIDRLFRHSGLLRSKWDERHFGDGRTYGQVTIEKAVRQTTGGYGGEKQQQTRVSDSGIITIDSLSKKYFVANIGGKTCVCFEEKDEVLDRTRLVTMSFTDFRNMYSNIRILVGEKYESIGAVWLKDPKRPTYDRVVCIPKGEVPPRSYNLWKGFSVEPVPGNWSLFERHLREIICKNNEEYYRYLIRWLANCVQNPHKQGWSAVALRGDRGVGKGTLASNVGKCFGQHYFHVTNSNHLVGHFNAHLRDCIYLFADEAYWSGDPSAEGVLKGLITEEELVIESKGKDVEQCPNRLHIIMATNNDWIVPAGLRERRYFVLDVADSRAGDEAYFKAIASEMENGGRSAFLYDLLRMDLSDFDVRRVPNTDALVEQKFHSMRPIESYWAMRLEEGNMPCYPDPDKPQRVIYVSSFTSVETDHLFRDYSEKTRQAGINRRSQQITFGIGLKKLIPPPYPRKRRIKPAIGLDNERSYYYEFPPLKECREFFEKKMGTVIDWEDDGED